MDNLTHTLTGLMLARCGLNRGVRGGAIMLMLAANAPDVDVVSWFGGTLFYLEHHREYTHSLFFAPAVAFIPWALVRYIGRSPLGLLEYGAALIGVLSHLLLDWTNVYGIRLFLPFSGRWLRLDMTDVIDPWILGFLIVALGAPALVKLVSDEIGGQKMPAPKRGWAWFAVLGLMAYEGVRYTLHERALGMLESHLYGDAPPERVTAVPDRLNPTHWRGVVEGDGFVYEVPVRVTEDFLARDGRVDYPAGASPAIDAAKKTRPFEVFAKFDQLPFWRLVPLPEGLRVELLDLRFGSVVRPGFMAVAEVTPDGHVRDSRFTFGPIPPGGSVIQ
jgi:inner membrane protein